MSLKKMFCLKMFFTISLLLASHCFAGSPVLNWTDLNTAVAPSGRYGHSTAFNPCSGQLILFGGTTNSSSYLNDTWAYDSIKNKWFNITPASSPSARDAANMVFDPSSGNIILFGGFNGSNLNDTWALSYDSLTETYSWTNISPAVSPNNREAAAMAFDPSSGQIILFGGYDNGELGDTWALSYDSTTASYTWTQLFPTTSPGARDSSYMVFDPTSGQIILFGGYSGGNLNDTWAYDGKNNTWTQYFPSTAPSARYGVAMEFDPCSGQVILFGGGNLSTVLGDTWAYNSNTVTWTQLSPVDSPDAREFSSMTFDPWNGLIILFGGDMLPQTPNPNDTFGFGFKHRCK